MLTPQALAFYRNVHGEDYTDMVFHAIEPRVFNMIDDILCWRVRQKGHKLNFPTVFYPDELEVIG